MSESARLDVVLPPQSDGFGTSIDVEGSLAIVGAPLPSGVAYIFRESEGAWSLETKLIPNDGAVAASFGSDVTIRGNLAVVGARNDDEAAEGSGAIYPFVFDGSEWLPEPKRVSAAPEFNGQFGTAVDMISGWLFVGAPREDGNANDSGAVHFYKRGPESWALFGVVRPDGVGGDRSGTALDADGLRVAIGAPGLSGSSPFGGEVHVMRKAVVTDVWSLEDSLRGPFTVDLGASVAVDGNTIVAGAPHTFADKGAALFFRRNADNSWTHFRLVLRRACR